jgi:hypothetical protein
MNAINLSFKKNEIDEYVCRELYDFLLEKNMLFESKDRFFPTYSEFREAVGDADIQGNDSYKGLYELLKRFINDYYNGNISGSPRAIKTLQDLIHQFVTVSADSRETEELEGEADDEVERQEGVRNAAEVYTSEFIGRVKSRPAAQAATRSLMRRYGQDNFAHLVSEFMGNKPAFYDDFENLELVDFVVGLDRFLRMQKFDPAQYKTGALKIKIDGLLGVLKGETDLSALTRDTEENIPFEDLPDLLRGYFKRMSLDAALARRTVSDFVAQQDPSDPLAQDDEALMDQESEDARQSLVSPDKPPPILTAAERILQQQRAQKQKEDEGVQGEEEAKKKEDRLKHATSIGLEHFKQQFVSDLLNLTKNKAFVIARVDPSNGEIMDPSLNVVGVHDPEKGLLRLDAPKKLGIKTGGPDQLIVLDPSRRGSIEKFYSNLSGILGGGALSIKTYPLDKDTVKQLLKRETEVQVETDETPLEPEITPEPEAALSEPEAALSKPEQISIDFSTLSRTVATVIDDAATGSGADTPEKVEKYENIIDVPVDSLKQAVDELAKFNWNALRQQAALAGIPAKGNREQITNNIVQFLVQRAIDELRSKQEGLE